MLTTGDKPKKVRYSQYLLWSALALGLSTQLLDFDNLKFSAASFDFSAFLVLALALHAYLIVGISRGRNSARWIYFLFFIGGLFFAPPNLTELRDEPLTAVAGIAQICLKALAFLWLFTKPGKHWFEPASVESEVSVKRRIRLFHRDGKFRIVRTGFCWFGFLFTALWAISEGIWRPFGFALLAVLTTRICYHAFYQYGIPVYGIVALSAYPMTMIVFGLYGNKWLINILLKRGYLVSEDIHQ